jgi:predicted ester cyclase
MPTEDNKAIVRRFIDAYNTRNLEAFDDLVAPDYIDHTHRQKGRESFRQLFRMAFEAFPDWHEEIRDVIAEGDRVWVCVKATGTHTGAWNLSGIPLPPTGNKVTLNMVFLWRIANRRLAEGWEVDSDRDFLRQLGLLEYTEKGKKVFPEDAGRGKPT